MRTTLSEHVWSMLLHPIRTLWHILIFFFLYLSNRSAKLAIISFVQTVKYNGYPCEVHQVTTRDGYHLTAFRIPHGKSSSERRSSSTPIANGTNSDEMTNRSHPSRRRPVVLLWHGLMDCSYTWVVNGPAYSLAYILADRGYDVWLGNNRGNSYSNSHVYLATNQNDYWRFSYDEFADYDMPDTIEYALRTSGQETLVYIGHSEGTTQAFAALSTQPDLARKISRFVGLGPVASIAHMNCPFFKDLAVLHVDQLVEAFDFRRSFTLPFHNDFFRRSLATLIWCFPFLANDIILILCGKPQNKVSLQKGILPQWAENEPGGTSVMNVAHWAQACRTGAFQRFDFGRESNLLRYGTPQPPVFDLTQIPTSLKKLLYVGLNDTLADMQDVAQLVSKLGGINLEVVQLNNYNHMDYLWDPNAAQDIYPGLLNFISEGEEEEEEPGPIENGKSH